MVDWFLSLSHPFAVRSKTCPMIEMQHFVHTQGFKELNDVWSMTLDYYYVLPLC